MGIINGNGQDEVAEFYFTNHHKEEIKLELNGCIYRSTDYGWEDKDYVVKTKCGRTFKFIDAAFTNSLQISEEEGVKTVPMEFEFVPEED